MTALLPPNASPFERAVDATEAARLESLDPGQITAIWDADRCPPDLLGYLAWQLSIDLWDDGWPVEKKRSVCRRAFELHRLKTTPAGIRAHLALVDAEVRRFIRPPARIFYRTAITAEARAAWLAALPQLRLQPFNVGGIARRRLFASTRADRRCYLGHAWWRRGRGPTLVGTHAVLHRDGADTPVSLAIDADGTTRAYLPGTRPASAWPRRIGGHRFGLGFLRATHGPDRVVAFLPDARRSTFALQPGADPERVAPTRVYARRIAPRARSFLGRPLGFLQRSHGPLLAFDGYAVADPAIGIVRRRVRGFHGHFRLGIRPYTAELQVVLPLRRSRRAFGRWHGAGWWRTPDLSPVDRMRRAIGVSKAARDTILVDTASQARATFRPGMQFGDFSFGDRVRNF